MSAQQKGNKGGSLLWVYADSNLHLKFYALQLFMHVYKICGQTGLCAYTKMSLYK